MLFASTTKSKKWHFAQENLVTSTIVYFKLTESQMNSNWLLGKVESVKVGKDGYVREATIAYKDTSSDNVEDCIGQFKDQLEI